MIIQHYCFDVITCDVSHFSFILIVRVETKQSHDVYHHKSFSYGSGQYPFPMDQGKSFSYGSGQYFQYPVVHRKVEVRLCLVVSQR